MHDYEQQSISQIAAIMSILVQVKHQLVILEAECNMIKNLMENLHKDAQSGASNQGLSVNPGQGEQKEEDTVQQFIEDMEIGDKESVPTNIGLEEATSCHIFHQLMFFKVISILGIFYRIYCSSKNWDILPVDICKLCILFWTCIDSLKLEDIMSIL